MHPIEHLRYIARSEGAPQNALVEETAQALSGLSGDPVSLVTATRRITSRHLTAGALWNLCAHLLCSNDPRESSREFLELVSKDHSADYLAVDLDSDISVLAVGWSPLLAPLLEQRRDIQCWVSDNFGQGSAYARALQRYDIEVEEFDPSGIASVCKEVDHVVLEAEAYCEFGAICASGSLATASVARQVGTEALLLAGAGRGVPPATFDAMNKLSKVEFEESGNAVWAQPFEIVPVELIDRVSTANGIGGVEKLSVADGPVAPELFRPHVN